MWVDPTPQPLAYRYAPLIFSRTSRQASRAGIPPNWSARACASTICLRREAGDTLLSDRYSTSAVRSASVGLSLSVRRLRVGDSPRSRRQLLLPLVTSEGVSL